MSTVIVTSTEAVIACGVINLRVTERQIRTWAETDALPVHSRGAHGRNLYDLADVRNLARAALVSTPKLSVANGRITA